MRLGSHMQSESFLSLSFKWFYLRKFFTCSNSELFNASNTMSYETSQSSSVARCQICLVSGVQHLLVLGAARMKKLSFSDAVPTVFLTPCWKTSWDIPVARTHSVLATVKCWCRTLWIALASLASSSDGVRLRNPDQYMQLRHLSDDWPTCGSEPGANIWRLILIFILTGHSWFGALSLVDIFKWSAPTIALSLMGASLPLLPLISICLSYPSFHPSSPSLYLSPLPSFLLPPHALSLSSLSSFSFVFHI